MNVDQFAKRIAGKVIPALPVPFRVDGTVDHAAQEGYIHYIAGQGVGAIAVWAHTGHGLRLTREQRRQVLRAWREGVGMPIVAGVGAQNGPDLDGAATHMAEEAIGWGADALLVHPPTAYRDVPGSHSRILQYHQALNRLHIPMILFDLYPEAGGLRYSSELLFDLLSLPSVVGIKLATLSDCVRVQDISALVGRFPGKLAITGEDRFLEASIMWGCSSALIGLAAACTDLSVNLLKAYVEGDSPRFVDLAKRIYRFARVTFRVPMEGYIRRLLHALAMQGVIPVEAAHDPFGLPLADVDLRAVETAVRELGYAPTRLHPEQR